MVPKPPTAPVVLDLEVLLRATSSFAVAFGSFGSFWQPYAARFASPVSTISRRMSAQSHRTTFTIRLRLGGTKNIEENISYAAAIEVIGEEVSLRMDMPSLRESCNKRLC